MKNFLKHESIYRKDYIIGHDMLGIEKMSEKVL